MVVYGLSNRAILNDLERTLTLFSRSHHSLTLIISQTATDTVLVNITRSPANAWRPRDAVFTYRGPHFCFPWGRSWRNHAKCCMDRKRIRCLQISSLHVHLKSLTSSEKYFEKKPHNNPILGSKRECAIYNDDPQSFAISHI